MEQRLEDFTMAGPAARPALGSPEPRPAPLSVPAEHELEPAPRDRSFLGRLTIAEWLLKHRDYLLAQIEAGREVPVILTDLLLVAVVPTAFYGLVTGLATNSLVRILTNPIKLPLVLIFTMVLCLPTLYIFSSYLGGRRTFLQTAALGFTSLAILGVVLAAFAPITWFLTFTAPHAYALHVLVNVAVLALAGFVGVGFLIQGTRRLHGDRLQEGKQMTFLWMWIVLYGLVGLEMGWLMSPFFSSSNELISVRGRDDETVFQAILGLIPRLFQ
ncbi:MAG TPA: hypothetical protein VK689_14770 [Armatimonadota bacterium]|nr:hypothetical protein [Armatimonadota bacterium]